MTAPSFEEFLSLSVDVTAFEETVLLGTGLARHYLAKVQAACGDEVVTALLDAHRAARADAAVDADGHDRALPERALPDRALLDRALRHRIFSDDRLGPVARNVIKLWYAGMWYALPPEWTDCYGAHAAGEASTVTAASYQEGLLWRAIGANPPGAKAPGYGSWAQPPRIEDRYLNGATK
ncbi:hypothetical protein [Streptomyces natalensis]|uniref:Gluconate 2-dehydrogenase subunit 3 family protein n=1 Tax=Streptomyces natalensis ATCC 27448 TaxID=1240678 RepID=A0A0D7CKA8_9ACTN|nr:hypothetical protein [Streptomyces natalensis]KIZ15862.1 hypothetical protein SNA_21515 [Streptomyces natalensis ATCC 27448]